MKIPILFCRNGNLIRKFTYNCQGLQEAKTIMKNKKKIGEVILLNWKFYYKDKIIKTIWNWQRIHTHTHRDIVYWCIHIYFLKVKVKVAQSCPALCDPMDLVNGILQAIILEWVAFPFSRGSSQPRDRNQVYHIAGGSFTSWATREAQKYWSISYISWWW